jgi:hypothetical protein
MNHRTFGLLYQVIVSLGQPFRILAFDGPFKGSAADVSIFRGSTLRRLLPGERVPDFIDRLSNFIVTLR